MSAFASFDPTSVALGRSSTRVGVYRYQPGGVSQFQYLPNIRVLAIQYREGADAGVARFRYVFDASNPFAWPSSFQDALSVNSTLPGVVQNDERLAVVAFDPFGNPAVLFDGFAQVPELGLAPDREMVTFDAFGVAIREWDTPIAGALVRDADDPSTVSDVETDLVTHFNADGQPNATPEGADATDEYGNTYATFLDPKVIRDPDLRRYWTLPMAIRYLCYRQNADETYVTNPDGSLLDSLLDSRVPDSVSILPDDPTTYTSDPIIVPDYPASGKAWPIAVRDLIEPNGFGMAFRLATDASGNPSTTLDIFRKQDGSASTFKDLLLQPRGSILDPAQTNLAEAQIARDTSGVANACSVESGLVRYEASFILAPGFPISSGDAASSTSLSNFDLNSANFSTTNHDAYRLYVVDETGEGHWNRSTGAMVMQATPLDDLFADPNEPDAATVKRRRVPIGQLFSVDPNQKPLKARLSISTNYQGTQPGLWDGTGTWQPVGGGYDLLKDRLGIWINAANPNSWNIQASRVSNAPYPAGVVKGIEAQALAGATPFVLRLTCVIEGDHTVAATADRRPSSPTTYTILRHVDARDRYAKHVIAAKSEFNTSAQPIVVRDDSTDALAEANARRAAGEAGEVAGSVTIPRFTQAYRIGDRIRSIQGRNLSLQTNAGAPTEEGEVFPAVVGLTWVFDGRQETVLQLSDERGSLR
jgi:hypothetical protein